MEPAPLSGWRRSLAGLACLASATALLLAAPDAAIPGMALLVAALLLELPIVLHGALVTVKRIAGSIVSPIPHVATMELSAARSRAVAIAATGAIAVFGSVAIGGAHGDLLAGLENATRDSNASTDLWVAPSGSYNLLQTTPFVPSQRTKLEGLPGVRAVRLYRSGLLDYGPRRVLVTAPAGESTPLLPADQLLSGNLLQATARVRQGGWLVLSQALAEEHHLGVGSAFTLPSPEPQTFRVAALSTNLGWAPGAIVMSSAAYARAWASPDASAYSILLAPGGASPQAVSHEIAAALGPNSGLTVQTATEHADEQSSLSREALASLTQIATLIPIVAVLAMAAAMGAMIWQRRPRLAKLKLEGIARVSTVAHDPLGEPDTPARGLPHRGAVRPVRTATRRPGFGSRDQLPGRLLAHRRRRAAHPRARVRHRACDRRDPRLSGRVGPGSARARGLIVALAEESKRPSGDSKRPYKKVARAKAQERTRETLLQAAAEEVERDRWTQTSLESVAERAGVTKQTALRHFGSKQGLLDAVLNRTASTVVKERDQAPIGDIAGAVANLVRHYERYGDIVVRMLPYRDAVVRVIGNEHLGLAAARRRPRARAARRLGPAHIRAPARGPGPLDSSTPPGTAGGDMRRLRVEGPAARSRPGTDQVEAALTEMLERLLGPDTPKPAPKGNPSHRRNRGEQAKRA